MNIKIDFTPYLESNADDGFGGATIFFRFEAECKACDVSAGLVPTINGLNPDSLYGCESSTKYEDATHWWIGTAKELCEMVAPFLEDEGCWTRKLRSSVARFKVELEVEGVDEDEYESRKDYIEELEVW